MKKLFIAAINLLLGALVVLAWALQSKYRTETYNEVVTLYLPKILLSFTVLVFLILISSLITNKDSQ